MKKISLILSLLLLSICLACQVNSFGGVTEVVSITNINSFQEDTEKVTAEVQPPTEVPTRVPASSTPTQELPAATSEPVNGTILMIFGDRFIREIYATIRPMFEEAGYRVVVASRTTEAVKAKNVDLYVEVDLLLGAVKVSDYDAILFLCDNDLTFGSALPETNRIAQEAVTQSILVGAICSGPRILAYAQVVEGLTVTGESSQTCKMLQLAGGNCTGQKVEWDGMVVTAKNRFASQVFGDTIIDALQEQARNVSGGESGNGVVVFYSSRDGNPEIYAVDADGGTLLRLTDHPSFDDSPAISPDGRQVVFLTARHDPDPQLSELEYEIYRMDIDGSNLIRLTQTDAAEDHPAWSPDGSKIIFDADYDGDGFFEIYTVNPDGTGLVRLTWTAANDQFADFSPDGDQIAFSSDRNGNWDIYVMDADGSNQQQLTSSLDWELFPSWSPNGMQIAFNGLIPRSRNSEVYIMNADGSAVRPLTNTPHFDENPTWSPDGNQIAFQTSRDGDFNIYVMNPDGSDQHPLVSLASDELWPSWGVSIWQPVSLQFDKSNQELGMRETFQVALGDLDGDGNLDALFANPMRNHAEVWLNDGRGTFANTGQQLTQYGHGVGLADFDHDGDLDAFIVCHQGVLPSKVYLNDGTGIFSDSGQNLGDGSISAADLNLLDLNGDGNMDVHVLYYSASGVPDRVYLNDGEALFRDSELFLDEDFIAWGDLDDDGDVDYFGKNWGEGYVVMLNDGSGQFTLGWQMDDPQATVGDVVLADFDDDGDLDALVANGFRDTGSYPSRLFWNEGRGKFTDSGLILFKTMGAHFAVGDLDLDGDLDVFVTNMDRMNEVWLYDGGNFTDSGLRLGEDSEMSGRPSLGDLDGDGDLDVVVGRFRGGAEIWTNQIKE